MTSTEVIGNILTNKIDIRKSDSPEMFNRISRRYDFLNRLLSARQDVAWRKKAAGLINNEKYRFVLDLATGTGDLILAAARQNPFLRFGVGVDPALEMLRIGSDKVEKANQSDKVAMLIGDGVSLPFPSASFDAAMIAFGIRNIENYQESLRELFRVLKPGGRLVVLEFSVPTNKIIRRSYLFYFRHILPRLGGIISGNSHAYRYLNRTVESFPYGNRFCQRMELAGFSEVHQIPLSFGIATIYYGDKHDCASSKI